MGDPHLAALHTVFRAEGWEGAIEVEAGIDGDVRNSGVARYRDLSNRHLTGWVTAAEEDGAVSLRCRTVESGIGVALAARTLAGCGGEGEEQSVGPGFRHTAKAVFQRLMLPLSPDSDAVVDKTVALYTSRDLAIGSPCGQPWPRFEEPRTSRICSPRTSGPGRICGSRSGWRSRAKRVAFSGCTSSTYCRRSPRTPPDSMWGYRREGCTVRRTGAMSSGTSCS